MVNSTEFGKRLQLILDYYGISATDFSNQISVNRSTISHLLSGRNKPSLDFVMKVLEKFPEVELYWILNGKGDFPSNKTKNSPISISFKKEPKTDTPLKQENIKEKHSPIPSEISNNQNEEDIERIIIFYKDGSFKSYKN